MLAGGLASLFGASQPLDIAFIASNDRTEQRYVLVLPELFDAARPHDLLICLHGHGSDRWQFVRDDRGEARAARDIAARHGMIILSPDYRAPASWMGAAAEADLVQIIGDMKKQYAIRKIILSGGSMGGASALTFTALHPDLVDGVVALNGHANHVEYVQFQDAIQASFGGDNTAVPEEYRKRSAEFFAEKYTMPVAMTAGGRDTIVPPDSVGRLAQAIKKHNPSVHFDFKDARGHETDYDASLAAYAHVAQALAPRPARSLVAINGRNVPPAAGSAAGVWFYSNGKNAHLLMTGHAAVPDSWRITASLEAGDEVHIVFEPGDTMPANIQFHSDALSPSAVSCEAVANAIHLKAGAASGAVRLTGISWNNAPAFFAPVRRPFSREPAPVSPEIPPAIADALVEWDWRMQDGIQTPREPRTYRQAIAKLMPRLGY